MSRVYQAQVENEDAMLALLQNLSDSGSSDSNVVSSAGNGEDDSDSKNKKRYKTK